MNVKIEESWKNALAAEWDKPYFEELIRFVKASYAAGPVFPRPSRIFAAFDACPFDSTNVVILGQDPYHGEGQAHGLCFSVPTGVEAPPSLLNIFKEMSSDLGVPLPPCPNTDLTYLAEQGVLLLNSTLTVEAHRAGSHQGRGWETFTDAAIAALNERRDGLVFILWGAYAIRKGAFIDRGRHLVLTSAHPSPLSAYRGFFGSRPFSRANEYLISKGKTPVRWL